MRSSAYLELPLDTISMNPYQPRDKFDQASLNVLTESIREVGVLQPVLVRPSVDGKYELIAGERRCRAARQAGLDRIPAVVRTVEDADTLEQALLENLHREDLNAIEEAAACHQLIDEFGFTQETVAKRLGRSRSAVANSVRLLQLPDEVKSMVVAGSLSAGHARALLGMANEKRMIKLAKKAVSDGLTVRMVEEAARGVAPAANRSKQPGQKASGADRGAAVLELESLLSDHLDTKVDVSLGKGQGKLVIQFADLDDLERIYRVMLQA
ncbi:ParB/RepB/Spo0J family partition protein [Candidatus Poriferisocius sp.]|uniref:ParB/RepB/Spo0J family partition protein n=1 Tax=Candidatus Poriferisocius sp. TaxID=3101276 RepID=UPI003B02AF10